MPSSNDWVNNPYQLLDTVFDPTSNCEINSSKIEKCFKDLLSDHSSINWIPSLNDIPLHRLKGNTLVRFRCMIQDILNPEYYASSYKLLNKESNVTSHKCGMYRDVTYPKPNEEIVENSEVLAERQIFYCVPIPGENKWVKDLFQEESELSSSVHSDARDSTGQKRLHDDDCDEDMEVTESTPQRRQRTDNQDTASSESEVIPLNFPLPNEKGPACFVKVYNSEDSFRVTDIFEFVGILSTDPFTTTDSECDESSISGHLDFDSAQSSIPASLVPRLHCVGYHSVTGLHPLYLQQIPQEDEILKECLLIRNDLLKILEECLFGDKLAAEYLLCHLMSTVYQRHEFNVVGKFCLNLSGCPKESEFTKKLNTLLENLVTKSFHLQMSAHNMNTYQFSPEKDAAKNRLKTGILQLSKHTHLVADETFMDPGELKIAGLQALSKLIDSQSLLYNFIYSTQSFSVDIPVLILSEGKSLLKSDFYLPLLIKDSLLNVEDRFSQIQERLTLMTLNKIRRYLIRMPKMTCDIPDDVQKFIEDDFVRLRNENKEMKVEQFNSLLVIARYLSISMNQRHITLDVWARAKMMEKEREMRIKTLQRPRNN